MSRTAKVFMRCFCQPSEQSFGPSRAAKRHERTETFWVSSRALAKRIASEHPKRRRSRRDYNHGGRQNRIRTSIALRAASAVIKSHRRLSQSSQQPGGNPKKKRQGATGKHEFQNTSCEKQGLSSTRNHLLLLKES